MCQITTLSSEHYEKDAQDCVLAMFFGDLSQSEIFSEIKLPLVTSTLTLMSDAASNSCIFRNGQKSQDFVASAIFTDCQQSNEVSHNFLPHLPLCWDFEILFRYCED